MKLQRISILIFSVSLTVFLILVSIFFSTILLSSYSDLEEQYIEKDLYQAINKLNDELVTMAITASDWGPWDDTVVFVTENDPGFISSNLMPETFENLHLNILVFTNKEGEVIYSDSYDLQRKVMVQPPDLFSARIDPENPLMNMSDPHQVTKGILMLPDYPLLVVSQPIVRSDYSGPAQGVVIMGRYLNTEEISKLRSLTRPSLTFKPLDDPSLSPDLIHAIRKNNSQASTSIQVLNNEQVAGYALLHDIYGNNSLILQITETREIYHQGLSTTWQVIFIILTGSFFLGVVIIILLNRLVLRRMGSIADQINEISRSGKTSTRVEIPGNDELSGLAVGINRMLETIEQTRMRLQEGEKQFRDLVENLPDYILVYGPDKDILYFNPAVKKVIGEDADTWIGMPVLAFVAEESLENAAALIAECDNSGRIPVSEIEIMTKGGQKKSVIVKGTQILFNSYPATLLLLVDITQRKEIERERDLHTQELERYSSSLRQAGRQLSLLTSITRHDILNRISVIYLYIGLAEEKITEPGLLEYLSSMKEVATDIQSQIEFTRIYEDIGVQEPRWQKLDVAIPRSSLPETIALNAELQDISIFADPMFEKVFINLLDNSVRHGQRVTEIRVYTYQSGDDLIVVWGDNGIGIAEEEKELIFDRGFGKHTGLGMFLVREVLSLTGITIRETGVTGEGARFEITVPPDGWRTG